VVKPADAPRLTEWLTPTEAAAIFGISRQSVNEMIQAGEFESLHLVGPARRPQYVISRTEVERIKATRRFPRAKTRNL
jgi:excisionase family DNA binding protein